MTCLGVGSADEVGCVPDAEDSFGRWPPTVFSLERSGCFVVYRLYRIAHMAPFRRCAVV